PGRQGRGRIRLAGRAALRDGAQVSARPVAIAHDGRGVTLVEILGTTPIFAIVGVAVGSFYVSTQRAFDYGSAQAFAQRQGTLLQEEVQRRLQRAVDFLVTPC